MDFTPADAAEKPDQQSPHLAFDLSNGLGHRVTHELAVFTCAPPRDASTLEPETHTAMSTNTPELEYMLLFRGTDWHNGLSPETVQTVMNEWYDWFEKLAQQGKATAGRPLAYQGKLVSGKKGHAVIDGPFAESKEAIGGYFLLRVRNEKEAVEIARNCPGLEHGVEVEVRPVVKFCPSGEFAAQAAQLARA